LWEPLNIAQTGRKLGIIPTRAIRFERGVDRISCCRASNSQRDGD
jgi:phenylalanyl-tRNA synthetase beta chain